MSGSFSAETVELARNIEVYTSNTHPLAAPNSSTEASTENASTTLEQGGTSFKSAIGSLLDKVDMLGQPKPFLSVPDGFAQRFLFTDTPVSSSEPSDSLDNSGRIAPLNIAGFQQVLSSFQKNVEASVAHAEATVTTTIQKPNIR